MTPRLLVALALLGLAGFRFLDRPGGPDTAGMCMDPNGGCATPTEHGSSIDPDG